jgi:hypothetical protein
MHIKFIGIGLMILLICFILHIFIYYNCINLLIVNLILNNKKLILSTGSYLLGPIDEKGSITTIQKITGFNMIVNGD